MNQSPLLFLGVFFALATSWFGFIVQPQFQLGGLAPQTNVVNQAELYPQPRSGLAQQGQQVYRALGCAACHTQQIRQTGAAFDVVLGSMGTNTVELVEVMRKLKPRLPGPEAGRLIASAPVTILAGVDKKTADDAAAALGVGGAKAQVQMVALGPDIDRGWGRARTVAADYLYDRPVLLGSQRIGPDLSNVGLRLPGAEWHLLHLYDPKRLVPRSVMPPYRFLFEKRKPGAAPAPDALRFSKESVAAIIAGARTNWTSGQIEPAPAPGAAPVEQIVPTDEAKALVAYLLSLRTDVPLFERPFAAAAASTNETTGSMTNAPGALVTNAPSGNVTNASAGGPAGAPATNAPPR